MKARAANCPVMDKLINIIKTNTDICYNSAMYVAQDRGGRMFKQLVECGGLVRNPWRKTHRIEGVDGPAVWFERPVSFTLECDKSKYKPKRVGVVLVARVVRMMGGVPMDFLYFKFERSPSISISHALQALESYTVGKKKATPEEKRKYPHLVRRTMHSIEKLDPDKHQGLEPFPGRMGNEILWPQHSLS